jgi:hypothetical protein
MKLEALPSLAEDDKEKIEELTLNIFGRHEP